VTAPQARLLVVDDNEDNRYTLTMMLSLEGYDDVAVANDGAQALEMLKEREFDLLLLDVMMPRLNGYEVLQHLKEQGRLRDLPVLMISAVTELDSVVRCIELGADDYLSKPFNPVLLKARLVACLEKKRLRDAVVAYAARMENELATARDMQIAMVPRSFPPPAADWPIDIHASMEPAREVGGDLYDFFRLDGGRFAFLLGDVCDKGVPAALFMARTKNLLRLVSELARADDGSILPAGEIVTRVNRELSTDNATLTFVTLFLGIIDADCRGIDFCNAGHNDPYLLSAQSGVRPLTAAKGQPMGIRVDTRYATTRIDLNEGDALFLFSDGITEALDAEQQLFSEARLEKQLAELANASAQKLVEGVGNAVTQFLKGAPPSDDVTMLALRRLPSGRS
jgi:sigma-B regulation protein RsbU (phosphoserine phosphatase)